METARIQSLADLEIAFQDYHAGLITLDQLKAQVNEAAHLDNILAHEKDAAKEL